MCHCFRRVVYMLERLGKVVGCCFMSSVGPLNIPGVAAVATFYFS